MSSTNSFVDFLTEEGYRPNVESYGDISFKVEGANFYIVPDDQDASYVHIVTSYSNDEPLAKSLNAANKLNEQWKALKVTLSSDASSVRFSFEAWYENLEHVKPSFSRILGMLRKSSRAYFDTVRAETT